MPVLSIIVPCYNEEAVLLEFHRRLMVAVAPLEFGLEILYVNDGSHDNTATLLRTCCRTPGVRCLNLSRNFGKESALSAGIDHALGEAVLFIDADLQDPPELIPDMVACWQSGFDVVNMQRACRRSDSVTKRLGARAYYALMKRLGGRIRFPEEVSDFRLVGAGPLTALRRLPERSRNLKGLIGWLGFKAVEIPYERVSRESGKTKWGFLGLLDLALESLLSFSKTPIRYFTFAASAAFISTLGLLMLNMVAGTVTPSHLVLAMLGFLAMGLALIGELVGTILIESKSRPHYLIADVLGGGVVTANMGAAKMPVRESVEC